MTSPNLVVDITISTPTGKVSLSQSPYSLSGETLAASQVTHRKHEVTNPFVEGTYAVNSLRENLVMPVSVYVRGETHSEMFDALQRLRAAFDQATFSMTLKMENHEENYLCFASDYSVSTQREFLHSRMARLDVQVNHYPEPQPTNQASDGHSHSEYAPLDSPHLTGQPRTPVPATQSNDDQIATTSWVRTLQGTAYVLKAGDTMTGPLVGDTDITARAAFKVGPAGGEVTLTRMAADVLRTDANLYADNDIEAGGNVRGQWGIFSMGMDATNHRIVNVTVPVDSTDAATKGYVDLTRRKTGWVMVPGSDGHIAVKRVGEMVCLGLQNAVLSPSEGQGGTYTLPVGFRPVMTLTAALVDDQDGSLVIGYCRGDLLRSAMTIPNGRTVSGMLTYLTDDEWPADE